MSEAFVFSQSETVVMKLSGTLWWHRDIKKRHEKNSAFRHDDKRVVGEHCHLRGSFSHVVSNQLENGLFQTMVLIVLKRVCMR